MTFQTTNDVRAIFHLCNVTCTYRRIVIPGSMRDKELGLYGVLTHDGHVFKSCELTAVPWDHTMAEDHFIF